MSSRSRSKGRPAAAAAPRRRERHGRGMRGALLLPPHPAALTRADRFDGYVRDAAERLRRRWPDVIRQVEFAVETVPPVDPAPWEFHQIPLGRLYPATATRPAHIVVYRRPVETRSLGADDLAEFVLDVVVEQVAALLGLPPEQIDPGYSGGH